ncbi:hypothetical protein BCV70DRAFT_162355, partial [Testicularia cyperi]
MVKVAPEYKQPLLDFLAGKGVVVKGSEYPTALIRGNQVITVGKLIQALEAIGCQTIRFQAYGMKEPLDGYSDLGNVDHPMADLNTFDLGKMYPDPSIILVKPRHLQPAGITTYPMLLPLGTDYGTVQMRVNYNASKLYSVKAYPRLVHLIKAHAGNQVLWAPKTVQNAKARQKALYKQLEFMKQSSRSMMGGLRLEVTVQAKTLRLAVQEIGNTPLLSLNAYRNPQSEVMRPYQLRTLCVSKSDYIDNLVFMLSRAE